MTRKTIKKNSPKRNVILVGAKNIRVYDLNDNNPDRRCGDGMKPASQILAFDAQVGKLQFDSVDNEYVLSVHSNCFYRFTV